MLPITRTVREMIDKRCTRAQIEAELKKPGSGFVSLRDNAVRLAREGITTVSEVMRVTNEVE